MNLIGNINAIPFRRFRGGGGVAPFPSIPGMIARYSALGLTNEQMKENPVWKDLTGNDHDLQMKNFAWKGMSGVGGVSTYYDKYEFTPDKYYMVAVSSGTQHAQFTFKVTGLVDGNTLSLADTSSPSNVYGKWTQDGIYTVDIDVINTDRSIYFYNGVSATRGEFTIEILPLYPGFIIGDGVDDYAVTEKNLDFEDTYTVYTAFIPFQEDPARNMVLCGKNNTKDFYMNYSTLNSINFYSSSKAATVPLNNGFNLIICKRTTDKMIIKNLLTNVSIEIDANAVSENPGLYYLWRSLNNATYANAAIAGQVICNGHFTTDEEDTKVLNWYKKEYPWLFFDQAWTVVGKSNEDTNRATIANITGNGNNLVLSNFGFAEGSGYNEEGEYAGYLVTDGVDDKIISSIFKMGNDWTVIGDWELINTGKNDNAGIVKFDSIVIYNYNYNYNSMLINIKNGRNILIPDQNTVNAICSDGRIYSKDWKESIYNEETESTSKNFLTIGYSGNAYTKIAFKNLAIYPTVLSREDCIKAYNYLQTLKAK